jgi:hypothetical protein
MIYRTPKQLQLEVYQREKEQETIRAQSEKSIDWARTLAERDERAEKCIHESLRLLGPSETIYNLAQAIENGKYHRFEHKTSIHSKWMAVIEQLQALSKLSEDLPVHECEANKSPHAQKQEQKP